MNGISSIDKRLLRLKLDMPNNTHTFLNESDVDLIKQAFKDAKWVNPADILKNQQDSTHVPSEQLFTGKEWYDKFITELWTPPELKRPDLNANDDGESHDRFYRVSGQQFMRLRAIEAAQRASGLTKENTDA